ncbi:ArsR/SmtB family transcription factor [Rhodoblastus sp.]|uniref:ArsR/SmtB family transcription factor n=1 Tax=Rhodoblastus sp. TaxID=1962975 RepID=UPI003F95899C
MDVKRFNLAAEEASEFIKSLANPVRLRILCALTAQECSVTMLAEAAGAPMSTISRHLALLRKDRIVKTRRESQTIFYSLADAHVGKLIGFLAETFCPTAAPARRRKKL